MAAGWSGWHPGEAAWAGNLTPAAQWAAEEGLPFRAFGAEGEEEDEADNILRKALTGAGHVAVVMGCSKGPGAARAGVRAHGCKGACGARVNLSDVA